MPLKLPGLVHVPTLTVGKVPAKGSLIAAQLDPVSAQHREVVLDVLVDLGDAGVLEDRPKLFEHRIGSKDRLSLRPAHCNVIRLALFPRKGEADEFGAARLQVRRFQIDGEAFLLL